MNARPIARFRLEAAGACLLLGVLPIPSSAQDWPRAIQTGLVGEPVLGLLNLPDVISSECTPAAIVLERNGLWFRIALQTGSAWIERKDPDDFLPYPDLLTDRLTYLGMGWDGRLWETAGAAIARPLPAAWRPHLERDVPITFFGSLRVGDQTWARVRLDPSARCGEALEGVPSVTGWIPARQPSGLPAAWFYSRGC